MCKNETTAALTETSGTVFYPQPDAVVRDGVLRPTVNAEAREASRQLARLAERQLNYGVGTVDPNCLRLFIEAHWNHIIRLANTIHESRERS